MTNTPERVIAYIDGFNLYFGMTSKYNNVKWLNIENLVLALLKDYQELQGVKYFTARVANNPEKERRQGLYLDAIKTTNTKIIYGHYKSKPKSCNNCGHSWNQNEEKMTDVNISVHMMLDAMKNEFDMALLISGDSDLVPPIKAIHNNFSNKKVVVAFPPQRHNISVKNAARGSFIIGRQKLTQSQFPKQIQTEGGYIIEKPDEW